jgi:hypothetical protein
MFNGILINLLFDLIFIQDLMQNLQVESFQEAEFSPESLKFSFGLTLD